MSRVAHIRVCVCVCVCVCVSACLCVYVRVCCLQYGAFCSGRSRLQLRVLLHIEMKNIEGEVERGLVRLAAVAAPLPFIAHLKRWHTQEVYHELR